MPFTVVMVNWWQCLAEQQTGFCLLNTSLKLSFFIRLETPNDSTKTVISSIEGFLTASTRIGLWFSTNVTLYFFTIFLSLFVLSPLSLFSLSPHLSQADILFIFEFLTYSSCLVNI